MKSESYFPKHALHHTYIVVGEKEHAFTEIKSFLKESFDIDSHYPDLWIKEFQSIGVDEVAEIKDAQSRKSIGDNKKFLLLSSTQITIPAQNSLLKMLEEPTPNTYFFIILPTASVLLPTVLSRAHVVVIDQLNSTHAKAEEFFKATLAERLKILTDMMGQYDKEEIMKEDIFTFINQVGEVAHQFFINTPSKKREEMLQVLQQVHEYMRDISSSLKLSLEYLALRLPRP